MRRPLALAALFLCATAATAHAQAAQPPTRPSPGLFGGGRPADPNRSRHQLTLGANLLAGYGDLLTPDGSTTGGTDPATVRESSYSGTADATLQHYYGRTARFINSQFRAFTVAYADSVSPATGGSLDVTASVDLGSRNTLRASQTAGYEPTLVLGAFTPLQGDVGTEPLPEEGGSSGILQQRSSSRMSSVTFDRRWTTRQSTSGTLSYSRISYLDSIGFDSRALAGHVRYMRGLTRTASLQASYRYSDSSMDQSTGGEVPVTDQTIDGGIAYSRRLSPTRTVQFTGGMGGTRVETIGLTDRQVLEYWMPSGYGSMRVDIGRSWALTADYRRAVNVLQGISLETFPTDAVRMDADGRLGRRLDVLFSGGFSNGRSGGSQGTGQFEAYNGIAQLRIAIARCCATTLNYQYYRYALQGVSGVPSGLPTEYDRHSIRVGLALYLPLYGSFPRGER